jgi:hypothetical protein
MTMKHVYLAFLIPLALTACASAPPEPKPEPTQNAPAEAWHFLNVPHNQTRTIDEPESNLNGMVTMTEVRDVDYGTYEAYKAKRRVSAEERRGGFVYFAVESDRDVRFGDVSAWVFVTERYRAPLPEDMARGSGE